MSAFVAKSVDITALKSQVKGQVLVPGNADYETKRVDMTWARDTCGKPAVLVLASCAEDVAAAIKFAAAERLDPAVACGSHGWQHHPDDSLCIDLAHNMGGCSVDPATKIVTVQGGALLGAVDAACEPHGIAISAGRIPSTGAGGQFTYTGGYGYVSRMHGLGADMMISAEVVLASGEIVTAEKDGENSDLFWGIRGGGTSFGVVTKFVLQAFDLPNKGMLFGGVRVHLPLGFLGRPKRKELLTKWIEMARSAPDNFSGDLIVTRGGRLTPVIEPSCWVGEPDEGKAWYKKNLVGLGKPVADTTAVVSYWRGIQRMGLGPSEKEPMTNPGFHYHKGIFASKVTPTIIDAVVDASESDAPSGVSGMTLFSMLGGVASRVPVEATPIVGREGEFWLIIQGTWDPKRNAEKRREHAVAWVRNLHAKIINLLVQENEGGGDLPALWEAGSLADMKETIEEAAALGKKTSTKLSVFGPNTERMLQLKKKFDPDNLFKHTVALQAPA